MTHILRLAFCGLRRLNAFRSNEKNIHIFASWIKEREWYDFKRVNIFIGVNGGGKSTILELIDAIRDPGRLANLPRENHKNNMLTAFEILFENGSQLIAQAISNAINDHPRASNLDAPLANSIDIQFLDLIERRDGQSIFSFTKNISKTELDEESTRELKAGFKKLDCEIAYWTPEHKINLTEFVRVLNKASTHLLGVLSDNFEVVSEYDKRIGGLSHKKTNPFHEYDADRVAIWLSDDTGQQNHIHITALPAGWRQLASILSWLDNLPHGSICLIEEPETHLHPKPVTVKLVVAQSDCI
jgi:hypothetical protein